MSTLDDATHKENHAKIMVRAVHLTGRYLDESIDVFLEGRMSNKKATHGTRRDRIESFQALVNVGPAMARDFKALGLNGPQDLIGKDPWRLYCELCRVTNTRQDPCVLDVMIATVAYMNGEPPQPWWGYTAHRKSKYSDAFEEFSKSMSGLGDQ